MKNWKTSSAGIAQLLGALGDIVHSISVGAPINWNLDIPVIITAVGLLVAKDATTSSTQAEVNASTIKAESK